MHGRELYRSYLMAYPLIITSERSVEPLSYRKTQLKRFVNRVLSCTKIVNQSCNVNSLRSYNSSQLDQLLQNHSVFGLVGDFRTLKKFSRVEMRSVVRRERY
jgi:hypothetical protein